MCCSDYVRAGVTRRFRLRERDTTVIRGEVLDYLDARHQVVVTRKWLRQRRDRHAITNDFWGNLDAISGKESWEMHGTGGDAKGQPTQTNSISHGSPYLRIRKILVGAAYA